MSKRHGIKVRWRAFRIWQELGFLPWQKAPASAPASAPAAAPAPATPHASQSSAVTQAPAAASPASAATPAAPAPAPAPVAPAPAAAPAPSAPAATPAPASAPASAPSAASSGNHRRSRKKASGDFYRGAFDSIPFLNEDAKCTFTHLLLRPGYMIRDYIRGDHERYLAPLTALIVFYAFFALVFSILQPVQHKESEFEKLGVTLQSPDVTEEIGDNQAGLDLLRSTAMVLQKGYTYLNLDQHPEEVHTQAESSLAALEGTLRSQGIPLFIGRFFLLWFALGLALRRYRMGMPAIAAASAYILCQFSFFMLFAVILTFGQSKSLGLAVLAAVMLIDLRQWLGETWKKSIRLTIRTGLWYAFLYGSFLLLVSAVVVLIAWIKGV